MTRKKQPINDLPALQARINELELSEAKYKQVLESCLTSEKRLRLMADSLPVFISYVDSGQRYRFNNKTYEEWFGLSRDEIYGKHLTEILGEKAYKNILEYVEKALSGKEVTFERLLPYKNAGDRHVLVNYVPDFGEHGKVNGFFVLGSDITQRVKSEESLKLYSKRLVELEETQKQRLARELHDQVGQRLSAIGMSLNTVRNKIPNDDSVLRSILDDSFAMLEQTTECIRDVMTDLRPAILDDYGLVAALRWYADLFFSRTGIVAEVHCEASTAKPPFDIENTLFRIVQEALTNVAKHATASNVKIILENSNQSVRLIIKDNGKGFDPVRIQGPEKCRGLGLLIMSERAQASGGIFRIESFPGQGTSVFVEVAG